MSNDKSNGGPRVSAKVGAKPPPLGGGGGRGDPLRMISDLFGLVAVLITLWNFSQLAFGQSGTDDWGGQINAFLESLGGIVAYPVTALLGVVPPWQALPWISVLLPIALSLLFLLLSVLLGHRKTS